LDVQRSFLSNFLLNVITHIGRKEMKHTQWALLFLLFILSGCGGGGGGSSASQAPAISNLVLQPGEIGKFNARFDFADQGGNVVTLTVVLYDDKGSELGSSTSQINDVTGHLSGTLQGTLNFSSLTAGDYSFEIFITDSGGLQSNKLSKRFNATGGFGKAVNYQNPSNYLYLGATAIGDLNGDGRNDVVAIQGSNNTGELLIYYQNESGKLNTPVVKNLTIETRGAVIADVNNDGKADLVLSGISKNANVGWLGRLVVFLQDPATGQLLPPQEYTVSSSYVFNLAVADLNGDGRNDVVVMAPDVGVFGSLSIFFQNSAGTFDPEVKYDMVHVMFEGQIHVADMDNDGRNDIVVQSGLNEFAVIRQTAPGVFSATPDLYTVQTSYWSSFNAFALGDVNGDGRIDVVTVDPGNNGYLNIFLQNSQGKLDPPTFVMTDVPFGVQIADITGDGLNDIIYDISGGIKVLPQQSNHTFGPSLYFSYPAQSFGGSLVHQALSIGDVTGDGKLEAVLTWSDEGLFVLPYSAQLVAK
jgi:hypothetical protein